MSEDKTFRIITTLIMLLYLGITGWSAYKLISSLDTATSACTTSNWIIKLSFVALFIPFVHVHIKEKVMGLVCSSLIQFSFIFAALFYSKLKCIKTSGFAYHWWQVWLMINFILSFCLCVCCSGVKIGMKVL